MKPFDLEKAMAGEPICCQDGHEAKFIAYVPEAMDSRQVVALINRIVYTFSVDGQYLTNDESAMDLFMASKKTKVWVNFYDDGSCFCFDSKEGAENHSSQYKEIMRIERLGGKAYPVEVEE